MGKRAGNRAITNRAAAELQAEQAAKQLTNNTAASKAAEQANINKFKQTLKNLKNKNNNVYNQMNQKNIRNSIQKYISEGKINKNNANVTEVLKRFNNANRRRENKAVANARATAESLRMAGANV